MHETNIAEDFQATSNGECYMVLIAIGSRRRYVGIHSSMHNSNITVIYVYEG